MDLKLEFDPEVVGGKMAEAIMEGTFRELFQKAATQELERLKAPGTGWNAKKVIEDTLNARMRQIMEDVIQTEFRSQIEDAVRAAITDEMIKEKAEELASKITLRNY